MFGFEIAIASEHEMGVLVYEAGQGQCYFHQSGYDTTII